MPSEEAINKEASQEGETPEHEKKEYEENGDTGVVLPEEFQKEVHGVIEKANSKAHLQHIRNMVMDKEDAMREAEMKKREAEQSAKSKGGSKGKVSPAQSFSTADMPSSY